MFNLELDASQLTDFHPSKMKDISPILKAFSAYMAVQTDKQFEHAGGPGSAVTGGEYRGVKWAPLSAKYRRRPSGALVSPASALLQDTGTLRQLAATEIVRITPTTLEMGTRLPYAAAQNEKRPFLFVTDKDGDKFLAMLDDYFGKLMNKRIM